MEVGNRVRQREGWGRKRARQTVRLSVIPPVKMKKELFTEVMNTIPKKALLCQGLLILIYTISKINGTHSDKKKTFIQTSVYLTFSVAITISRACNSPSK